MSEYIYAGARTKALETNLLSKNQVEVLLSTKNYEECLHNLHETFIGPYLVQNKNVPIPQVLEYIVSDAKELLVSIAPKPKLLNILWLKYDFYNLSAIIKGARKNLPSEELEKLCFNSGVFPPSELIDAYKNKQLHKYDYPEFRIATEMSEKHKEISEIDRLMNVGYFKTIKKISDESDNNFLKTYTSLLIDFFNVQANLRALSYEQAGEGPRPIYVNGGSISKANLENEESLLKSLSKIGSYKLWEEAIAEYKKTKSYSLIETEFDNQIEKLLREESRMEFSIASLYAYFHGIKNNVQIVRTILVAKRSGLPELELRKTIRKIYG